jgi:hypothetical protein
MQQIKHFLSMLNATHFGVKLPEIAFFSADILANRPRPGVLRIAPTFN